jgi:transcriptional regulator with XRE-family HTH domain
MRLGAQFGRQIRTIRRSKGLTQREVADAVDLERTHLSRIEQGTFNPQLDTIVLLAQGLRVSLSELFEGIEIEDVWDLKKLASPPRKGLG